MNTLSYEKKHHRRAGDASGDLQLGNPHGPKTTVCEGGGGGVPVRPSVSPPPPAPPASISSAFPSDPWDSPAITPHQIGGFRRGPAHS